MAYPYPFGYCQESDVFARILTGQQSANVPGGLTDADVDGFIAEAAAQIDSVLAKTGYVVPLAVAPGFLTIGTQVWQWLLDINAIYAAAEVESVRHASDANSEDKQSAELMAMADDLLNRIALGSDNLLLFGAASNGWAPDPNPTALIDVFTSWTDWSGNVPMPQFTINPGGPNGLPNPLQSW